jgi:methionyl-tRNA formyltransferase
VEQAGGRDGPDELRIVFMGTPGFAVPSLQALLGLTQVEGRTARVIGVITQPDRPAGRGGHVGSLPVKQTAVAAGVLVWQPARLRRPENVATLAEWRPDLIVVAAFAQILPPSVLALPRFGCLNVHASLLPRWRGADPVRAAILAGDEVSGVTIIRMDEGLDTGAILSQRTVPIDAADTGGSLEIKLARVGADLLAGTLPAWVGGRITPRPQDERDATLTRPLRREDGILDWRRDAVLLARQVRAYHPWPGTATTWNGRLLKVLAAHVGPGSAPPGAVLSEGEARAALARAGLSEPAVVVGTGSGLLLITRLQLEGKRQMSAGEFLAGYRALHGASLGAAA